MGATTAVALASQIADSLPRGRRGLFHPYAERCEFDDRANGPERRLERLARHMDVAEPRLLLVGEAPGYQGCRYTGVAFTSERQILAGAIPRLVRESQPLTTRRPAFSEPSATSIWRLLYRFGVEERTVLFNALQMHPFREGRPWTNRTPTDAELRLGADALNLVLGAFHGATVVAVGRSAERALTYCGAAAAAALRHPAFGGVPEFSEGFARVLGRPPTTFRADVGDTHIRRYACAYTT